MQTNTPVAQVARLNHSRKLQLDRVEQLDRRTVPMGATRSGAPLFTGNGIVDYTCVGCGAVLCQRMRSGQLAGMVLRCACGDLHRVPGA